MRLSHILPLLLAGPAVSALPSFFGTGSQVPMSDDTHSVPGKNPLKFCANPSDYILEIKKVDLDPNPPSPGDSLSITAKGELSETVKKGAKVHLQVKYGLITLINQEEDLCDQLKNVDKSCPLKKGDLEFSRDVDLPKAIPKGKYTVLADVYTEDGDEITCLNAEIVF